MGYWLLIKYVRITNSLVNYINGIRCCVGNGNVGVIATDRSYLHLALNQPSITWLKLPFSPLVSAKAAHVPKPMGKE